MPNMDDAAIIVLFCQDFTVNKSTHDAFIAIANALDDAMQEGFAEQIRAALRLAAHDRPSAKIPEGLVAYVNARNNVPMRGVDDTIHEVNTGSEHHAELKLSDLRALMSENGVPVASIKVVAAKHS